MLLNELLTSTYDWSEKMRDGRDELGPVQYEAKFKAGDRVIQVSIDRLLSREGSHWEMCFSERMPSGVWSTKVTGSDDEFKVFATVVKITKQFMEKHDVDTLTFTAEKNEGSRVKLYQRMVDRLIGGKWEKEIDHKGSDYRSYFTIKKKA